MKAIAKIPTNEREKLERAIAIILDHRFIYIGGKHKNDYRLNAKDFDVLVEELTDVFYRYGGKAIRGYGGTVDTTDLKYVDFEKS